MSMRTLEELLEQLTEEEQDMVYRHVWKQHVKQDVLEMDSEADSEVDDTDIDKIAELYVDGHYDCNQSYWENLSALVSEVTGGDTDGSDNL